MANKAQVVPWELISLPPGCCCFFSILWYLLLFLTYIWLESCRSEISGEENNRLVCDTVLFDMEKCWIFSFPASYLWQEIFQLSTDSIYTNMHKWFLKVDVWDLSIQDFLSFQYVKILLNRAALCPDWFYILKVTFYKGGIGQRITLRKVGLISNLYSKE